MIRKYPYYEENEAAEYTISNPNTHNMNVAIFKSLLEFYFQLLVTLRFEKLS